jgi:LmbE family N-acetylglucosaminyl deacetylase
MDILPLYPDTPAGAAAWFATTRRASLARAARKLGVAIQMVGAGAQFIPLGDNRRLLNELSVRVNAARECGA